MERYDIDEHWQPATGPERLAGLADGIFSVALTLAVVEILPPELGHRLHTEGAAKVLAEIGPNLTWIFVNFMIVSQYWIAHHRTLAYVRRVNRSFIMANMYFLMLITVIPFALKVFFSDHSFVSVAFYSGCMALVGLSTVGIWHSAVKNRLVDADLDPRVVRYGYVRGSIGAVIFLLAIPAAAINLYLASFVFLLLFLHRPIAERITGGRPSGDAGTAKAPTA